MTAIVDNLNLQRYDETQKIELNKGYLCTHVCFDYILRNLNTYDTISFQLISEHVSVSLHFSNAFLNN